MNNFNFSDCRKAVNQAAFRPTKSRKALALQLLSEAVDFINNLEEVADKPSKKAKSKKRRRKTTKRTPSQKVADRQDRQALATNEVGPIKPSKKAKTASVKEAAASAKAVSEATGAAQRAAKKAELRSATAERAEVAAQPSVESRYTKTLLETFKLQTSNPNHMDKHIRRQLIADLIDSHLPMDILANTAAWDDLTCDEQMTLADLIDS